jgi:esterase/lipase
MSETQVMQGAEPFFFEGGDVGCLVSHGFTGNSYHVATLDHDKELIAGETLKFIQRLV